MYLRIKHKSFIIFTYVLSALMIIGQLLGVSGITSLAYALSFLTVLVLWCLHIKEVNALDLLAVSIIALSLLGAIATYTTLSVSYFINWITFAFVFLYFSVCLKIKLDRQALLNLFRVNFIVAVLSCIIYIVKFDWVFYVTNTGVRYLQYDFYNPNTAAIFLFCIAVTGMLKFFFSEHTSIFKQIVYITLSFALIIQTLSRTVFIAIVFFVVIYVIFKRKGRYFLPKGNIFCMAIATFPLIFAIVYSIFIQNPVVHKIFSFLVSEGKEMDSRRYVWEYAFRLVKESPIFGSYGYLLSQPSFSQMHNSHLNVMVSYGVIVFVLVVIYLFLVMKKITAESKKYRTELCVWAFVVCLILGCGEAILFSGGLSFYLFVGQFLLLANVPGENIKELDLKGTLEE